MSYGAAAVLGSLTAAIPRRWRPAWIGSLLAVGVAVVAVGRDFTDVGHAGGAGTGHVGRDAVPSAGPLDAGVGVVMLGVAAAFGYLVLASADLLIATAAGLAGVVVAECWGQGTHSSQIRAPTRQSSSGAGK
jgi:hypothetical protein